MKSKPAITFRPITPEDEAFLSRIYASTREWEMSMVDWDDAQKKAFLQMQFSAQDRHYHEHYPTCQFQVIEVDGQKAGRLYIDRWPGEIRIVDISLLPEYRNGGIGSTILKDILREGMKTNKPVRIHVEAFNPALSLYTRLGFTHVGEHGIYLLMERPPSVSAGKKK